MQVIRRSCAALLAFFLVFQMILMPVPAMQQAVYAESGKENTLGNVVEEWSRPIALGVEETTMVMDGKIGRQSAFVMDVDVKNPNVVIKSGLPNGKDFGMQTVRQQASYTSKPNHVVVGGVNADFYNMSNGVPLGAVIQDGKILKGGTSESFGMKENGEAIIGHPNPQFSLSVNGVEKKINNLNIERGANQLIAYTPNMKTTGTNSYGIEVVVSEVDGDMRKTGTVSGKIEKVIHNKGNEPIQEGQIVLSGHGTAAEFLNTLTVGQEVAVTTKVAEGWEDVNQALGGRIVLVKDGKKVNFNEDSFTTAKAPRTAVGIREDGTVFFVVIDGRQPGYADGVTVFELRDFMYELGAKEALNLDGGGSSTFVTRQPGESELSVMNKPSDGKERSVANSFLIVSTAPQTELSKLAILPDHLLMLSGSKYSFLAKGMDASYNPVEMNGTPSWSVEDAQLGNTDQNGLFTAGEQNVTGNVVATLNGAKGSTEVTVTTELSQLKFPQKEITVKRSEEVTLKVDALLNGRTVHADPQNFTWIVNGDIGTIDENGVFKAGDKTASGTITVQYGNVQDTMNVQVGKMPIILETFENGIDHWTASGARYNSVSIRQTTYPEPVRFDNHALQLNYDFIGTIGTSGAYAYPKEDIEIDGYPETIGMWVYGDGAGHWLRAQMKDGNNNAFPIDFTSNMDWKGWKYVEAPIPEGKATPLKLDLAVRVMETKNDHKNAGTIYVDNIRAVYGETNDDLINPEIINETPAENEVVATNKVKISAIAKDNEGGTGINRDRIFMYVDGKKVNVDFNEETGEVSYVPEEELLDGYHLVKTVVQDRFGNETEKTWQFEVNSGNAGIKPVYEENVYVGNDYPVTIEASQLEKMNKIKLHFKFDPNTLNVKQNALQLHKGISAHHVVQNEIDSDGNVWLELKDLQSAVNIEEIRELAVIPFEAPIHAKNTIAVQFVEGEIMLEGKEAPISLYMPTIHAQVNAHLSTEIDRASTGFPAKLHVRDEKGKSVGNVQVKVISPEHELAVMKSKTAQVYEQPDEASPHVATLEKRDHAVIIEKNNEWLLIKRAKITGWIKANDVQIQPWLLGETNTKGEFKTDKLSIIPGELIIQANKDQQFSFQTEVNVLEHLGTNKPERTNITFNGKKKSMNITWSTSPKTTKSVVELVPTAEFKKNGFAGKHVSQIKGKSNPHPFEAGEIQVHYATLHGLKHHESYTYRVGDGTKDGWSEPAEFTTNSKEKAPFNFILMGDTQAPPNQTEHGFGIFTELFKKAKEDYPDASFMVHVGDMIDDGNLYSHWNAFFESIKDPKLAASTPIVPTVGNHENIGNGVETYKQLFRMPQNGPEGFKGTAYSFDYGNAHFAVLNTETTKEGLIAQGEWLKADMEKSKNKWKIVVFHRAPYYSNPQGGSGTVLDVFPKVFDEIGIDLAISGHDHSYVRTFPLKNGVQAESGTTYLIAGSTGTKFYPATPQPYMDVYFDEKTQVYTNIAVDENRIKIIAKTRDGRIIDEHTISKK